MVAAVKFLWEETIEAGCEVCPEHTKCMRPATWDNPLICVHETWNFPLDLLKPAPIGDRWWQHLQETAAVGVFICFVLFLCFYIVQMLWRKRHVRQLRAALYHLSFQIPRYLQYPIAIPAPNGGIVPPAAYDVEAGEAAFVNVELENEASAAAASAPTAAQPQKQKAKKWYKNVGVCSIAKSTV